MEGVSYMKIKRIDVTFSTEKLQESKDFLYETLWL